MPQRVRLDTNQILFQKQLMKKIEDMHEIQLDIALNEGLSTWGTCDRLTIYDNDTALLGDYKTGISQIDHPEVNYQAIAYTIGVFQKWEHLKEVTFVFYIPLHRSTPSHTFSREELPDLIEKITGIVKKATLTRPKWESNSIGLNDLSPNQNCRFCQYENSCPALGFLILDVAKKLDHTIPDINLDEVDDPETVEHLYNIAKIVEAWADRHRKKAVRMAKEGVEFPTLRLKSMGATSSVTDVSRLLEVAETFGVTKDEAIEIALVPLGKLSKLVGDKAQKGKKSEMQRFFVDAVEEEGILQKSEIRYTLS